MIDANEINSIFSMIATELDYDFRNLKRVYNGERFSLIPIGENIVKLIKAFKVQLQEQSKGL